MRSCLFLMVLLAAAPARSHPYVDAVLADHPVSYWPLSDQGPVARDVAGMNPGVLRFEVSTSVAGPVHGLPAIAFPDDQPTTPVNLCPSIIATGDIRALAFRRAGAIEAWVMPTTVLGVILRWRWWGYTLTVDENGAARFGLAMRQGNAINGIDLRGGSLVQSPPQWHHVVGSWDGATATLWVDGTPVDAAAATGVNYYYNPDSVDAGEFAIGRDGDHCEPTFRGAVGHVAVYAHPLDETRVAAHLAAATMDVGGEP